MAKSKISHASSTGSQGVLVSALRVGAGDSQYVLNAHNVLLTEAGVILSREGYHDLDGADETEEINRVWYSNVYQQILRGSSVDNKLDMGLNSFTSLDTTRKYSAGCDAGGFFYLLSNEGQRQVSVDGTTTEQAIPPEGLSMRIFLNGSGTLWLAPGNGLAYRYLVRRTYTNGKVKEGAPSGRSIYFNTQSVLLDAPAVYCLLADDVLENDIIVLYGTNTVDSVTVDPGDAMFEKATRIVTSTDISNGYVLIFDHVPSGVGGNALYSGSDQPTAGLENWPCEAATGDKGQGSMCVYDNRIFATGYRPRSSIDINLLSVFTTNGLVAYDITGSVTSGSPTITGVASTADVVVGMGLSSTLFPDETTVLSKTVNSITATNNATGTNAAGHVSVGSYVIVGSQWYFGWAVSNAFIVSNAFLVSSDPSPSVSVRLTVLDLVNKINILDPLCYARYLSTGTDTPGYFRVYAKTLRDNSITIQAPSGGEAFAPNLTEQTNLISDADDSLVLFSQEDVHGGFPPQNYLYTHPGAKVSDIKSLGYAIIVTTNLGSFRITGSRGMYNVDILDNSVLSYDLQDLGPGLSTVCANTVYAISTQGMIAANESSAGLVSDSISAYMNKRENGNVFSDTTRNIVYTPLDYTTFAFNARTGAYWSVDKVFIDGIYCPVNQCMYATTTSRTYRWSTKFQYDRYYDQTASGTILSIVGDLVTLNAPAPFTLIPGDAVVKGGVTYNIETVPTTSSFTVRPSTGLTTGAVDLYKTIRVLVDFAPQAAGDPSVSKAATWATVVFDGVGVAPSGPSATGELTYQSRNAPRYATLTIQTDLKKTPSETLKKTTQSLDFTDPCRFTVNLDSRRGTVFVTRLTIQSLDLVRFLGLFYSAAATTDRVINRDVE